MRRRSRTSLLAVVASIDVHAGGSANATVASSMGGLVDDLMTRGGPRQGGSPHRSTWGLVGCAPVTIAWGRLVHVAVSVIGLLAGPFLGDSFAFRSSADLPEFEGGQDVVRWQSSRVAFRLSPDQAPPLLEGDIVDTIDLAFAAWAEPTCSSAELWLEGLAGVPARSGDGVNTIQWIGSEWPYGSAAAGTTEVLYEKDATGVWHIVEADIYLNATDHRWRLAGGDDEGSNEMRDVLSVVTHEAGHALGLLHPCEFEAGGAPDCDNGDGFAATTMYPAYSPEQATLDEDDKEGVCYLYPAATCERADCVDLCGGETCAAEELCIEDECVDRCSVLPCEDGVRCADDSGCDLGFFCLDSECSTGSAELGDACSAPEDCASAACNDDGFCAVRCNASNSCSGGDECSKGAHDIQYCADGKRGFGEPCSEADDCLGHQCAAGARDKPVCTRLCGSGDSECPLGWSCDEVDGRRVCLPNQAGGGCTLGTQARGSKPGLLLLALIAWLVASTRRKSRAILETFPGKNKSSSHMVVCSVAPQRLSVTTKTRQGS